MARKTTKPIITQKMLLDFESQLNEVGNLKWELKRASKDLDNTTAMLMQLFQSKSKIEKGRFTLQIVEDVGPSRPPWKDLYITHMLAEHGKTSIEIENQAKADHPGKVSEALELVKLPPTAKK